MIMILSAFLTIAEDIMNFMMIIIARLMETIHTRRASLQEGSDQEDKIRWVSNLFLILSKTTPKRLIWFLQNYVYYTLKINALETILFIILVSC